MLDTLIHRLHFDTEKLAPSDWQVNWDEAPLPYKLYRDLPEIQLDAAVPFDLKQQPFPSIKQLGHLLWYTYGLTQIVHYPERGQSLRRFVPSGGGLYPNEVYVYIKLSGAANGIYHYDVAHHRLLLLREGNFDEYIAKAVGTEVTDGFCAIFISTFFWKNFFKYHHFSYRLQGLDTGVLIGQLLEVAAHFGYNAKVCYQFLDRAIHHLLGLQEDDESVYAIIPLTIKDSFQINQTSVTASELSQTIPRIAVVNHNLIKSTDFPLINRLNRAAMIESTDAFVKLHPQDKKCFLKKAIFLDNMKELSYNFLASCRKRYSPESDFIAKKIHLTDLSILLKEACSFSYQHDLESTEGQVTARVSLYGSFYNVERVENGAYVYDERHHALRRITVGDHRHLLQTGLVMPNVNLFQVPLCMHIVGNRDYCKDSLDYRGYRIQQMEAGILTQRLLLFSSALDMGGHPLLGFTATKCDQLYQLESEGKTSLIQIPIGPCRARSWLKGALQS